MSEYHYQEPARVKCIILRETERALLITQDPLFEIWIPRSQCLHISKLGFNKTDKAHKDATIEMPEWLAEEKGLNYQ